MNTLVSLFQHSAQMSTYLICLLAGLAFVAITGLASLFGGGDTSDVDADGTSDFGGVDGDNDTSHPTISIFSPRTIAVFAMGLGAGGAIATAYGASTTAALFWGLGVGAALGAAMLAGMSLLHRQRASSEIPTSAAIGQFANVVVTIPEGGMGQVDLSVQGQYMTYFARSQSNHAVPKGTFTKVVAANGGVLIVE